MGEVSKAQTRFSKSKLHRADSSASKMVPDKKFNITKEKLEGYLPRGTSHKVTDDVLKLIANMEEDTGLPQDLMEEEVLGSLYLVSRVPRTKLRELINAVKFCNLKRNYDNKKAWSIVFPEKYDKLMREGRQVDSHVAMYNQSQLVVEIDKEMLIPFHLQYAPYAHAAIKKQFDLMKGRAKNVEGAPMNVSAMVQHLAAKSLFEMTAPPESTKIDLTIGKTDEEVSLQKEMNIQLAEMVKLQKARLDMGESIDSVQQIGVVNFVEGEIDG